MSNNLFTVPLLYSDYATILSCLIGGYNFSKMIDKKFVITDVYTMDNCINELISLYGNVVNKTDYEWDATNIIDNQQVTNEQYLHYYNNPECYKIDDTKNIYLQSIFQNHTIWNDVHQIEHLFNFNTKTNKIDYNKTCLITIFNDSIKNKEYYNDAIDKILKLNNITNFIIYSNSNVIDIKILLENKHINYVIKTPINNYKKEIEYLGKFRFVVMDNNPRSFVPVLGLWKLEKFNKFILRPDNIYNPKYSRIYRLKLSCNNDTFIVQKNKSDKICCLNGNDKKQNINNITLNLMSNHIIIISTISRRVNMLEFCWEQIQKYSISDIMVAWFVTIDKTHCENEKYIEDFTEFAKGKPIIYEISNSKTISDLRNDNHEMIINFFKTNKDLLKTNNDPFKHEIIICCQDDDDYYVSESLRYRIRPIIDGLTDITGQDSAFHVDITNKRLWRTKNFNCYNSTNAFLTYTLTYLKNHTYDLNKQFGEEKSFLDNFTYLNNMYQIQYPIAFAITHFHNTVDKQFILLNNYYHKIIDCIKYEYIDKFIPKEDQEKILKFLYVNTPPKDFEALKPCFKEENAENT